MIVVETKYVPVGLRSNDVYDGYENLGPCKEAQNAETKKRYLSGAWEAHNPEIQSIGSTYLQGVRVVYRKPFFDYRV